MLPPRELRDFAKVFQQAGFQCYLVGGALRNIAMRRPHTDWDIATDATPEQVGSIFQRVIPTGARHGTVTVHFRKLQIEVTTFRIESDYSDSRHPDSVTFTRDIHEDLKRRDFTMNAMALNLHDGAFVDPHNGLMDIKGSIIRAIGVPDERFSEDGLRILRAVRFAAQLDFAVDDDTRRAMTGSLARLSSVSPERIRDELSKTLQSPHPSIGLNLAQETGVLKSILPELDACVGVEQATAPRALIFAFSGPTRADSAPSFDVFKHSILACDGAPADVLELRMAALLHDIGKAPTFARDAEGNISFHGHELVSAELTTAILQRLRYPNAFIRKVTHLVAQHMFHYEPEWSDAAVRRFIMRVGREHVEDLYRLRRADTYGKTGRPTPDSTLDELQRRVEKIDRESHAITIADLAINGDVLAREAGIPRGPVMGTLLKYLLDAVIEDPAQNTREILLSLTEAFRKNYMNR